MHLEQARCRSCQLQAACARPTRLPAALSAATLQLFPPRRDARRRPCLPPVRSYAPTDNSAVLWSTVWSEDKESGVCTGLPQDEWMKLAVQLRDT